MFGASDGVSNVVDLLVRSTIATNGVSFEGRSLKLDNEKDAEEIVNAIKECKDLHFLNLAGNTLGVDAAKAVGKALQAHKEFKRALWKDLFTGRLKTEIPMALQYLGGGLVLAGARLTELDMSDNAFGPIGVEGLAVLLRSEPCYALQELRLNNNGLGIGGGKLLAKSLLECHKASTAAGQPLALKIFVAGRNRLENDGAKALAEVFKTLGTLQEVVMPQNGIYHVGISALVSALTHCPQLRELNLNDNTVTWRGATALAEALPSLPLLSTINLGDCLLKTKGAIILSEALTEGHQHLKELILGFNEIGAKAVPALMTAMKNKTQLTQLMVDGNQFGEGGRAALKKGLEEFGKGDALASLEEDESEEESENEGEEEEEEESGSETEESTPTTPAKATTAKKPPGTPATPVTATKVATPSQVIDVPESPVRTEPVSLPEYIKDPSPNKLASFGKDRYQLIINEFESYKGNDHDMAKGVRLLMAVCTAAATKQEDIRAAAVEIGTALFSRLFKQAESEDTLSLLNNAILVNLQVIKCEETNKVAKVPWNHEGCMIVLEHVCRLKLIPFSTKDSLQLFLGRPSPYIDPQSNAKRKLMTALFQF